MAKSEPVTKVKLSKNKTRFICNKNDRKKPIAQNIVNANDKGTERGA